MSYKWTFEENENIESELRYRFAMLRCCSYLIVLAASDVVRVRQACQPDSDNSLGDWRRPEVSSQSETRTTVTRPGCLDRSRRWRKGCIEDMEGPDINSAA